MRAGQRFGLSAIEKRDVWSRWKAGQSLHEIGRAFDKPHSCIRSVLLPRGGIPPAARRRSRLALTLAEREDISRGIASDSPLREIARRLDRAASTVSREISRHGGRPAYRALDADRRAWDSALRPKKCLLAGNRKLRDIVASKLILDWSPEQISGWLETPTRGPIPIARFVNPYGSIGSVLLAFLLPSRTGFLRLSSTKDVAVNLGKEKTPLPSLHFILIQQVHFGPGHKSPADLRFVQCL